MFWGLHWGSAQGSGIASSVGVSDPIGGGNAIESGLPQFRKDRPSMMLASTP